MALGEHTAGAVGDRDGNRATVFESQGHRCTNQRHEISRRLYGTFDSMHSRDRQSGLIDKTLVAGNSIADLGNHRFLGVQVANPRILLDQLHHACSIVPQVRQNLLMRLPIAALVLVSTSVLFAQDKTVDQGVYTSAQAARGAKLFESNCTMCHREPGGTAPVLAGERFTRTFSDATLQTVFTTIKTTMPRNAPGSLSDAEYVDLVTHLLKINSYADGMSELAVSDLPGIKIPGQTGNLGVAVVQGVGGVGQNRRDRTM